MQLENPIESLSAALYSACLRDLPAIQYRDRDWDARNKLMEGMSAKEKAHHLLSEKKSGQIHEVFIDKERRPAPYDCEVVLFPQLWGSTTLGYGGIGGQAMTSAYTIVVTCRITGASAVYFGPAGRLAYLVPDGWKNEAFREDIQKQKLPARREAEVKYRTAGLEQRN